MPSVLRDRGHFSESPILSVYSRAAGAGTAGETPQNEFGRSGNVERDRKGGGVVSAKQRGVLCVFAAAVLYSIGGLCIKVIPWNGMSINGARTAVALVVIGLYLWAIRHKPRMNRWVLLGALAVCGTNILFSIANKMTTAANAIVLQFTAPIFVMVFTAIFFRRRPGKLDLVTCAAVLGGIRLEMDGTLLDGTVQNRLASLRSRIAEATL